MCRVWVAAYLAIEFENKSKLYLKFTVKRSLDQGPFIRNLEKLGTCYNVEEEEGWRENDSASKKQEQ